MRITILQIILSVIFAFSTLGKDAKAQEWLNKEVSVSMPEGALIKDFLKEIEKQTHVKFIYSPTAIGAKRVISVKFTNKKIIDILNENLRSYNILYKVMEDKVLLSAAPEPAGDKTLNRRSDTGDDANAEAQVAITGKVSSVADGPLPMVSVRLKGSNIGVNTDNEGRYSINLPEAKGILTFSYVGFITKEVDIAGRTTIDVILDPDSKSLDEIVVIGYGTTRKSDLTGAVGTVKEEQLKERPATSLNQGLAGRIAGVQVNTNSGRPGGQTNVRIRGFSSINSTNNPLYVVDGVMLPVGTQVQYSNAIDFINPNDIVSVEVLKDASSTAIYGARGANGVILVTTKRGKSGQGIITYDADFSVPTVAPNREGYLNAREFLAMEDQAYKNMEKYDPVGWNAGKYAFRDPALARKDPRLFDSNGDPIYDTDWLKESTQHKLSQNHQLGFRGGGATNTYSFNLGYRDDEGLLLNSYLKRFSGSFNYDDQIKKWIKVGGSLRYTNQEESIVNQGESGDSPERLIAEALPILPVKFPDGSWADYSVYPNVAPKANPVHLLTDRKYLVNTQNLLGSAFSNIKFVEGLEMRTVLGVNVLTQAENQYTSRTIAITQKGTASVGNRRETFWSLENYLTYNKTFAKVHAFTALGGVSWQATDFYSIGASIQNFSTDYFEYNNLGAGSLNPGYNSNKLRFAFSSYFGRLNYTYKDKYLLTVTGRADGSSKFGQNHKYSFFPSAALAWRVSEEDFLKENSIVSNLKLRTSYGVTGNSEIPSYSSLSVLNSGYVAIFNNTRVGGTGISRLANPDLKWEKTTQTDFGVELGLFDNRISLEADIYYRKTTDMLLDAPVPRTSGYATIRKNIGSMENKGLELALNTVNVRSDDFSWNTSFNISFNRNKVLSLATPSDIFGVGGPNFTNQTNIIRVGEPVGSFWGLVRLGTWSEAEREEAAKFVSYRNGLPILPGDVKYLDVNGDHAITDADRMIIGNGNPKAWGGFLNNFTYKNWNLIVELQYSYGNDILDMTTHSSEDRQLFTNSYKSILNAWTPQNQNTPIAEVRDNRAGYVTNVDTHWIKDGSFIRGKNLLLGYNFPSSVTSKLHLSRLKFYASVQNFFLLTEFKRNDPEVTSYGNSAFAQGQFFFNYPRPIIYMMGFNIGL